MSEEAQTGDAPAEPAHRPTPGHRERALPAEVPQEKDKDYPQRFERRFQHLVDATAAQPDGGEADDRPDETSAVAVEEPRPVVDRRARLRRDVFRSVLVLVIVFAAAGVLRFFVVGHYYIPSASMEPTLHGCPGCNDDHVLVDKLSYRAHPPRPGDIVVFDRPPMDTSGEAELIKRVIGTGGDTVVLRNGRVYVNGVLLDEPYVNKRCGSRPTAPLDNVSKWTIPKGDLFVLGDNRCNSWDSRAFGPIKDSSVVGRAFAIVWPLKRAGGL